MSLPPRCAWAWLVLAVSVPPSPGLASIRQDVSEDRRGVSDPAPAGSPALTAPASSGLPQRAPAAPSIAPDRRWGGYLGGVERMVQTAIGRAGIARASAGGLPRTIRPLRAAAGADRTISTDTDLPRQIRFLAPVPNPSRGRVAWRIELPHAAEVRFETFDLAGRLVHDQQHRLGAGRHAFDVDLGQAGIGPGVYFTRMNVDGRTFAVRRMVLRF